MPVAGYLPKISWEVYAVFNKFNSTVNSKLSAESGGMEVQITDTANRLNNKMKVKDPTFYPGRTISTFFISSWN